MLVLTAVNIESHIEPGPGGFRLLVDESVSSAALAQLEQYERENRGVSRQPIDVPVIDRGVAGVVVYLLVIWSVPALEFYTAGSQCWRDAGVMDASAVRAGEWWRTVTALTLHGSLTHIVSNSVFGIVFGLFLGRYLGSGLGWFLVVVAAAIGNGMNAGIQVDGFRSIGASTAMFAALGTVATYIWRYGYFRSTDWRRSVAPIFAGFALLAFTGTSGDNTDVLAHFTGFLAGAAMGVAAAEIDVRVLDLRGQRMAGILALAVVGFAWFPAIHSCPGG
jgi:membrane associated rhomboid family serine protease